MVYREISTRRIFFGTKSHIAYFIKQMACSIKSENSFCIFRIQNNYPVLINIDSTNLTNYHLTIIQRYGPNRIKNVGKFKIMF